MTTRHYGFLSRHRRRRLHRLPPRRRTAPARAQRARRRQSRSPATAAISTTLAGVEFLEGDLADLAVAERAVDGVDFVLHQAAIPSVPRSVKDPITSNRANVDGTLNVLVAARDAGVKRLVFAGSSSAYGDTPTLPKREDMPTEAAVAVRAAEAGRRAVLPDVHRGSTGSRR